MAEEQKKSEFASEMIDLPSEGKVYPEDSPLRNGKLEIKYMTAREEDILTSQNLIKKGIVVDKLLDSLILTKDVNQDDLVIGDKNAVMVASRILAYGSEYACELTNPNSGNRFTHTFNLADCPFKKLPADLEGNKFNVSLPISKKNIEFKLLTGKDEKLINQELQQLSKIGTQIVPELTTRLRHSIVSVDGDDKKAIINAFSQNMLARDSMFLREEMKRVSPDIEMQQTVDVEGDSVVVDIPMTANFFWPSFGK